MTTFASDVIPAASGGTGVASQDNLLPWEIVFDPFSGGTATVGNWIINIATTMINNGQTYNNNHLQNDYIEDIAILAAGTWDLIVVGQTNSNAAIITAKLNGSSVGTIDQYSGSSVVNTIQSITGISVATTGKYTLRLIAATKNASSTDWYMYLTSIRMRRTA